MPPAPVRTYRQLVTAGFPGSRVVYPGSINALVGAVAKVFKDFLIGGSGATTPFTLKWSSNGVTGPTNPADNTDRITGAAWIRQNSDALACSWMVLESGPVRSAWTPSTAYAKGNVVVGNAGTRLYICKVAGTSAGSGGPTSTSPTIVDGACTWQFLCAGTGKFQVLFAYRTDTDGKVKIQMAPYADFTLNGTNTAYVPTSLTAWNDNTYQWWFAFGSSTTSGDRIVHCVVSDDGKCVRWNCSRANASDTPHFWIEDFNEYPSNGYAINPFPLVGTQTPVTTIPMPVLMKAQITPANFPGTEGLGTQPSSNVGNANAWVGAGGLVSVFPRYHLPDSQAQDTTDVFSNGNPWVFQQGYGEFGPAALFCPDIPRGFIGQMIDFYVSSPSGYAYGSLHTAAWWHVGVILMPNPSGLTPVIS